MEYKSGHKAHTSLLGTDERYHPLHSNSFGSTADRRPVMQNDLGAGGYHDREGMSAPVDGERRGVYIPNSRWTITFTAIVVCQALIALALEIYVFAKFEVSLHGSSQQSPARAIPTYLALFIFAFVYQLGLTYDALRHRNTIQVIGLCIYNYGMVIYAAIEYGQVNDAIKVLQSAGVIIPDSWVALRPYLLAAPCILALGSVLMTFVAWKLYQEFAWDVYKSISADLRMRHRYLTYQIYIALLKFDFFFFLGFTVQFLVIVGNNFDDVEFWLTIAAVPVTIIILLLAALFCRHETKVGQSFIILIYFAAMAYFSFKIGRMYDTRNQEKVNEYYAARTSLTTFAVITLILLVITITTAILCMRNFGKGLKPYVVKRRSGAQVDIRGKDYSDQEYGQQLGPIPGRMVID